MAVMGDRALAHETATPADIAAMQASLREALEAGAAGFRPVARIITALQKAVKHQPPKPMLRNSRRSSRRFGVVIAASCNSSAISTCCAAPIASMPSSIWPN
jgi:N-acyl-D-aspartate/D-glutamate deacylase